MPAERRDQDQRKRQGHVFLNEVRKAGRLSSRGLPASICVCEPEVTSEREVRIPRMSEQTVLGFWPTSSKK